MRVDLRNIAIVTQTSTPNDEQVLRFGGETDASVDLADIGATLISRWRLLVFAPLSAGALALAATFLVTPTFTAKTTFLPPQQQQSSAASALAALGSLSGLAGSVAGIKTPGDQYVALLESANVRDRIVDRFKLMDVYDVKFRVDARKALEDRSRINLGKKDGLISVEVDSTDPAMAADMANQYVAELRRLSSELALTEAQQRRAFFEAEVKRTQLKLAEAQKALQVSGFDPGALKAEPKAAAEEYAKLKAEATTTEVRLETMRKTLAESAPEVQRLEAMLAALRGQLARTESTRNVQTDSGYITRYRDYKYQESLFELLSRQFEAARLDESREGALIQVVDRATPPERKSKPKRGTTAVFTTLLVGLALAARVLLRRSQAKRRPAYASIATS